MSKTLSTRRDAIENVNGKVEKALVPRFLGMQNHGTQIIKTRNAEWDN